VVNSLVSAEKKKPRKPSDDEELLYAALAMLQRDLQSEMGGMIQQYFQQSLQIVSLQWGLTETLVRTYAHAVYLGRRLAGNTEPPGPNDENYARTVVYEQARYLAGLLADLAAGKYVLNADGSLPSALLRRLLWYARRLRGAANQVWGLAQAAGTLFLWNLGQTENHCAVCPEREAESHAQPYTAETIPGWPGDFSTPCLGGCDCTVTTVDGRSGFPMRV
jgi:hypothetical protein